MARKFTTNGAFYYAPYVPMIFSEIGLPAIVAKEKRWGGWTTYTLNRKSSQEILDWCKENFGALDTIRWRHDFQTEYNLGTPSVRIWLCRPDDITLFNLRWL